MLRFVIVVPITLLGLRSCSSPATAGSRELRAARAEARRERDRVAAAAGRRPTAERSAAARTRWRASTRLGRAGRASRCALRLIDLGDRPFHHDESQDAYFSWLFRRPGDYQYNPLLHGPLRFYLTGADVRRCSATRTSPRGWRRR